MCAQYFSVSEEVQCKLHNLYEDSNGMANSTQVLLNCLEKHDLDISNVTAYAADNANVNFRKYQFTSY